MRLLIAGAGGHARVVADAAEAAGWREISCVDDAYPQLNCTGPWPVIGRLDALESFASRFDACVAAFGDARLRLATIARARAAGFTVPAIVHPRATVSRHAEVGAGSVAFAGCVVNVGAVIGVGCIVNTGATVDHDVRLEDGVHICPGAHVAGGVTIGECSWFGIGAVAKQGIRIGSGVTVGAGAACVHDLPDGVTVVGVPARERRNVTEN